MSLSGQRVVLLGGTSGIGFAVAQRAAAEGAQVVLASSNPEKVATATRRLQGSTGFTVDVTDEQAVQHALGRVGAFDHLVFTAGDWGGPRRMPLVDLDFQDAHRIFGVRFWGFAAVVKHAVINLCRAPASRRRLPTHTCT